MAVDIRDPGAWLLVVVALTVGLFLRDCARLWQDCYGVALARKQHKEGLEKLANDLKAKYD